MPKAPAKRKAPNSTGSPPMKRPRRTPLSVAMTAGARTSSSPGLISSTPVVNALAPATTSETTKKPIAKTAKKPAATPKSASASATERPVLSDKTNDIAPLSVAMAAEARTGSSPGMIPSIPVVNAMAPATTSETTKKSIAKSAKKPAATPKSASASATERPVLSDKTNDIAPLSVAMTAEARTSSSPGLIPSDPVVNALAPAPTSETTKKPKTMLAKTAKKPAATPKSATERPVLSDKTNDANGVVAGNDLTKEEMSFCKRFMRTYAKDSTGINRALRSSISSQTVLNQVQRFLTLMPRFPLKPFVGTVFRRSSHPQTFFEKIRNKIEESKSGKGELPVFRDAGFLSTSKTPFEQQEFYSFHSKNTRFYITSVSGYPITKYVSSSFKDENEVLFLPNTRFLIKKLEHDPRKHCFRVYMEEMKEI